MMSWPTPSPNLCHDTAPYALKCTCGMYLTTKNFILQNKEIRNKINNIYIVQAKQEQSFLCFHLDFSNLKCTEVNSIAKSVKLKRSLISFDTLGVVLFIQMKIYLTPYL